MVLNYCDHSDHGQLAALKGMEKYTRRRHT